MNFNSKLKFIVLIAATGVVFGAKAASRSESKYIYIAVPDDPAIIEKARESEILLEIAHQNYNQAKEALKYKNRLLIEYKNGISNSEFLDEVALKRQDLTRHYLELIINGIVVTDKKMDDDFYIRDDANAGAVRVIQNPIEGVDDAAASK